MAKYRVNLRDEEKEKLNELVKKGKAFARDILRARILLYADEGCSRREIVKRLGCSYSQVCNTIRLYCQEGIERATKDLHRKGRTPKLQGKQYAHLIALACSTPPEGRTCWTMQLLADKCVELKLVDSISDETVRRTLKKTKSSPGKQKVGAFLR